MRWDVVKAVLIATAIGTATGSVLSGQQGPTPRPDSGPVATPAAEKTVRAASATSEGIALYEEQKYAEAKILLGKAVALDAGDARAQAYLGMVLLNWDADIDGGTGHLERAVRLDPDDAKYHQWLGEAYLMRATSASEFTLPRLLGSARAELEKAVELGPKDLDARMALLQFYLSAPTRFGGSDAKAEAQAMAMTTVDPYKGLVARGLVAERQEATARAEQLYRTAIAMDPRKGDAYNSLGYLLLNGKRHKEAIAVFHEYVAAVPQDANAHDSLAEGLLAAGLVRESIAEYRMALEIDPRFASSYLGLAKCYEKQHEWEEEAKALRKFLEVVPNGPKADEAHDRLDELDRKQH